MISQQEQYYRKVILVLALLFSLFSLGLLLFLKRHEVASESYLFKASKVTADGYVSRIEHLEESSDDIAIAGWLIRQGTPIDTIERQLILKETTGKNSLSLATEIIAREDLKTYGDDGLDYTYSGFFARVDKSELNDDMTYELYLLDEVNDLSVLVPLNKTIREGQIK